MLTCAYNVLTAYLLFIHLLVMVFIYFLCNISYYACIRVLILELVVISLKVADIAL